MVVGTEEQFLTWVFDILDSHCLNLGGKWGGKTSTTSLWLADELLMIPWREWVGFLSLPLTFILWKTTGDPIALSLTIPSDYLLNSCCTGFSWNAYLIIPVPCLQSSILSFVLMINFNALCMGGHHYFFLAHSHSTWFGWIWLNSVKLRVDTRSRSG